MGSLTFFSAFSILVLGTPDDLADLRAAASAALILGSVEPPATGERVRAIGKSLNRGTHNGLRLQCPIDVVNQESCTL